MPKSTLACGPCLGSAAAHSSGSCCAVPQVRATLTDPQVKTPVDLSGVTIAEKTIVRREKADGRLCRPRTAHSLGRPTRWESETDVELRGDRNDLRSMERASRRHGGNG